MFKKEWVKLMVLNAVVFALTLVVDNATNLGVEGWVLQIITTLLTIVRMFNKTSQDRELIRNGK